MPTAKIRQRRPVDDGSCRRPQPAFENRMRVGTIHRMHGIKAHAKLRTGQQGSNPLEIKQRFKQLCVIGDGIDDRNNHIADVRIAQTSQVDRR